MFAIDRQVQRWLKSCKRAENSRNEVNDKCLDLDEVIEQVLNGTFTMTLPPAFMKVKTEASEKKDAGGKHRGGESEESKGRKKRRSEDSKGTVSETKGKETERRDDAMAKRNRKQQTQQECC